MCPRAARAHVRQQPDDQLDRAEVVELHRAFEVVEAVVAERDRAPDRAPGVVHQHVDVAVVCEHALHQLLDRFHVGDVGRVDVGGAAGDDDLGAHFLELLHVARHEQRHAAGRGDLQRGRAPDPRRCAGDQHVLCASASRIERPPARAVHLALPVVPQSRRVVVQRRRLLQRRALQRLLGFARVERGRRARYAPAPPRGSRARQPDASQLAQRRQRERQRERPLGHRVGEAFVNAQRRRAARAPPPRAR